MKTKIYIAGKITGDPNYRAKFEAAAVEYKEKGYVVITPSCLPEGMRPADYMRICFAMIDTADVVAFLPGYETSRGAQLELQYCLYTGKSVRLPDYSGNTAHGGCDATLLENVNKMLSIKKLRCSHGLTQKQLADALGVHQTAVSQWEKGATSPAAAMIPKLISVFKCGIAELYSAEGIGSGNTLKKVNINFSRLLGEKKMNISELSRRTGISRTTLTKLYYGEGRAVSYSVLAKICDALCCRVADILEVEDG